MNVTIDSASRTSLSARDEHAGQHGADADQDPHRDEELERIVEVLTEAVVAARRVRPSAEATVASAR